MGGWGGGGGGGGGLIHPGCLSTQKHSHNVLTGYYYSLIVTGFGKGMDFVHPDPCRSKVKPRPLIGLLETGAWLRIDL